MSPVSPLLDSTYIHVLNAGGMVLFFRVKLTSNDVVGLVTMLSVVCNCNSGALAKKPIALIIESCAGLKPPFNRPLYLILKYWRDESGLS